MKMNDPHEQSEMQGSANNKSKITNSFCTTLTYSSTARTYSQKFNKTRYILQNWYIKMIKIRNPGLQLSCRALPISPNDETAATDQ